MRRVSPESHLSVPARWWTVWPGSWPSQDHHQEMSETEGEGDLTEYGLRLSRLRISLIVRPARSRLSSISISSSSSSMSSSSCNSRWRSRWEILRMVRRYESNPGDASGEFECHHSGPPLPPRQSQARPPALPPYPSSAVSLVNNIAKTILS